MGLKRFRSLQEEGISLVEKTVLTLFVLLYPLFVSMYTMLPPLIGLAGYFILIYIEKEKVYIFAPLFYLLNLDFNLSLPLFFSIFITILIYMFVYTPLKRTVYCKSCLLVILVIIIDFAYYVGLFIYDFMFNTNTVLAEMLLVYYIVLDILIGVLL